MELDAVEGRFLDGADAAIAALSRLGGKLPLVLTAVEIFVNAALGKFVEAAHRLLQSSRIDAQHHREYRERVSARYRARDGATDRTISERIFLEVLRVENQIGGKVGVFVARRIEQTELRHDTLKERLVGKTPPVSVHHKGMRAAQLDDPGMDAGRRAARRLRRYRVRQHDPQTVLDLVHDPADLGPENEA